MKRILPIIILSLTTCLVSAQQVYYSLVPDFTTATESNLSISVVSQETAATDVEFSNDGLKMFVLGTTTDAIYDYTLTSAFSITTAAYSGKSFSVAGQETNPQGMTFNQDGTKLYVVGTTSGKVHEYALSTAFDLSTASFSGVSITVSTQDTGPVGLDFNPEGSKMYILGSTGDAVYEYDLSTHFSVSSAVYNSASFSISSNSGSPSDIQIAPDGKSFFIIDQAINTVFAYEINTAHQIKTASLLDQLKLANSTGNTGFAFSRDFTKVATVSSSSSLTEFSMGKTAFKESTDNDGTLDGSLIVTLVGDTFANKGKNLEQTTHYTIGNLISGFTPILAVDSSGFTATLTFSGRTTSDKDTLDVSSIKFTFTDAAFVTKKASEVTNATGPAESNLGIDLNAGFNQPAMVYSFVPDISKATNSGSQFTLTDDTGFLDFTFSDDGKKMFAIGSADSVYQYSLSTAFDVTTATSDNKRLFLGSQDTSPIALQFDNSGSRLFVLGATNDAIFRYNLSSSFDVSTASYSGSSFVVSSFDTSPSGFTFNGNGTKLYLVGNTGRTIDEFQLGDAFNLNSSTFTSTLSLATSNTYNSIQFAANGTSFYVGTASSILQYNTTSAFKTAGATLNKTLSLSTTSGTYRAFRFSESYSGLVLLNSTLKLNGYSIPGFAFEETADNDGKLEGSLVARIRRGIFSSNLTSSNVSVIGIPSGFTSSVTLGDDRQYVSIKLTGQTESNDLSNSVSNMQISFTDDAFQDLRATDIKDAKDAQTGLGISFISGSNIPVPEIIYSRLPNISNVSDTVTRTFTINDLEGFVFNRDGSKLYTLNLSSVSEYSLSKKYDITTASLKHQLSISSQETAAHGLAFNDVGSRLYVIGSSGKVSLFRLTQGFDLSTATFDSAVATISEDSSITDITFNDDGKKMYVLGDTNDTLYEYELSSAFDPSTATLKNQFAFGTTIVSPQGLSFSLDGSTFFLIDSGVNRFYQYDLSTPFSVNTATAKLINVSVASNISNPTAIQIAGDGKSLLISGTVSDKIHQYSFPDAGFVETSANNGTLEGRIIARLIGDTFTNAGGTFTNGERATVSNVPLGIDPSIKISATGLVMTVDYTGNALNNDTTNNVADISIQYSDNAFTNSKSSEVSTGTSTGSTGFGISYKAGSQLVLKVELSNNNEVITNPALDGNISTVFSWRIKGGTQQSVIDTVTINASYNFGSILSDFTLFSSAKADGSNLKQLSPQKITISDSLVSFQKIGDTLAIIEEVYYFIRAKSSGVTPSTNTLKFNLVSTNMRVSGSTVSETTVVGGDITFTNLGFRPIQNGVLDSIAYGETKIVDVNNDDMLDIVVAGRKKTGSTVLKYFTNSNGTFSTGTSFGTAKDSVRLAPGDFDHDSFSRIDVLIQGFATNDNGATLYTNDNLNTAKEFDESSGNLVNGDIASGDLDGDGDLDFIITGHENTNNKSFKVRVFVNGGNGNYSSVDTLSVTPIIDGDLELADVDNDGDLDLFITGKNASGNSVAELHIRNKTGFALSSSSFTGVSQSSADFGDYDSDGDLDLVVSGINGATISSVVYTNNGSGGYAASSINIDKSYAGDVKWIDLDNDGDVDLVQTGITSSDTTASVWINNQAALTEAYSGNISGLAHGNISYGDIDGDDDLDLVLNGVNGASKIVTQIYENTLFSGLVSTVSPPDSIGLVISGNKFTVGWDSTAGFQYEVIFVQVDSVQATNVLRSADSRRVNGFVRNPEKPRLRKTTFELDNVQRAAYRIGVQKVNSISKGSEFKRITEFFFGTPFGPIAISASDLTANSFQANWTAQAAIDSFTVTLKREETVNGAVTLVDEGTFGTKTNSFEFTNLRRNRNYRYTVKAVYNGLTSVSSNEIRVVLPLSSLFVATNLTGLTDAQYDDLAFADIDNDDQLDIVATSSTSSFVLLNNGSTTINLQAPRDNASIEVFDFGNDGDIDVFLTGTSSGSGVTSFFQNNASTFTETVTNSSQFLQAKTTSGDIDNDGDIDLVMMGLASSTSVQTEILINNGTNFDGTTTSFIADIQGDLELTDFDLDGDLDLLIIGTSSASLHLNTEGTFSSGTAITVDFLTDVDLKLGDMTGDGIPDIVYTGVSNGSSFLKIYSVNASLELMKITDLDITAKSGTAPRIEVIDGDNDGTLDVFLIGDKSMELYTNLTKGVLTDAEAAIIGLDGLSGASSAFGDFDEDGDVEVLVSGLNAGGNPDASLLNNANDTGNEKPSAPTGLGVSFLSGNWQLKWNPASDDKTAKKNMTYNVLIESSSNVLTSQNSNAATGFRKISRYGAIQDTAWVFNPQDLPVGNYSWKVQAIDASNLGSAFSSENPLTIPDTLKIFDNFNAINGDTLLGGTPNVVFFSFAVNSSTSSTLDSIVFNMTADYREYLSESSFKLFQSVDATADLSPEDQVVSAVTTVSNNVLSVSGLNIPLSQQQVYFFLVADAKFVAAEGQFQLALDANKLFVKESNIVAETNTLTGKFISIESAITTYTPIDVAITNFEASSENDVILGFSLNTNAPGVQLMGLASMANASISERFENVRIFSSTNNTFDAEDSEIGTFTIDNTSIVSSFSYTITEAQTENYFFVVADILASVSQSTASINFTLNDSDLTLSSTNRNTVAYSTADYTFYFDLIPPVIQYGNFESNVQQGTGPYTVSFTVQDQSDITAVSFFWRQLTASTFQEQAFTLNAENSYSFEFSASDIGDVGLEFYASARDADSNVNDPDVRSIGIVFDSSDPIDLKTEVGIKLEGESVTDYSLLAFPFEQGRFSDVLSGLENAKHGAVAELFGSGDDTKWRLISLDKGATDASGFNDLGLGDTFRPGEGYYLIVGVKDVDIQVVSGETVEASSSNPHTVSLSAGWNLIGNPYLIPVSIESLRDYNFAAGNISSTDVINDIRLYKDGRFVANPSSMDRFDGAFIRVTENVSNFAFPMNDEIPDGGGGGRLDLTRWDEHIDEDSWRLNLTLSQGNQLSLGGFGLKSEASDEIDIYDQYVLPAPGDYIRMQHEINGEKSVIRNSIQRPALTNVWKTSVHAVRDGVIKLEWETKELDQLAQSLYLFDPAALRFVDMKSDGDVSITVKKGENDLLFYYGPDDLKEEELATDITVVGHVYPNPVLDQLNLNILGSAGSQVQVTLYDLFGKAILHADGMLERNGINSLQIPFEGQPNNGLYFLEVLIEADVQTIRSKQKILIHD